MDSPATATPWLIDTNRLPTNGELAEMVAAQRQLVARLQESSAAWELVQATRTLRLLQMQLKERVPAPGASGATGRSRIDSARALANAMEFAVPESHRKGLAGKVVTGAKRQVLRQLRPFNTEVLRPLTDFNREVVEVLYQLADRRSRGVTTDDSASTRARLTTHAEPTAWRVQSHRPKLMGRAIETAKASYLKAVEPVLRVILDRQAEWNRRVIDLCSCAASPTPVADLPVRLRELEALCDPLHAKPLPFALRASSAVWAEVFRNQVAFNRTVVDALAELLDSTAAPPVREVDYKHWIKATEPKQLDEARRRLKALKQRPLVTLVMPAFNTPPNILKQCVDSVIAQLYTNWELCVVDDGSPTDTVERSIQAYQKRGARIVFKRLASNSGIAAATNEALAMATGDIVAFLDHDDVLAPHALSEVVAAFEAEPTADLVYSDEDRLNENGERTGPFFKPDWSPDLLRSANYICHLLAVRRPLLDQIGRLDTAFNGSQDYDFVLRATERARKIVHIPRILYHWRMSSLSLSMDPTKLEAASKAGVQALQNHLARCGERGQAYELAPTIYSVRYPVQGDPLVSIIVPFKDKPELLRQLVSTLLAKTRYQHFELLLVSNNSVEPETHELLASLKDPRIRVLTWDQPFNYPAINNYAAKLARGSLLLFLNNDIEIIQEDWLDLLIGQAQRPEVGQVGAKLLFPSGRIQHAGVVVGVSGFAAHPFMYLPDTRVWTPFGHADWTRNYLAVTSACVMLRRDVFERLRGFDETFQLCGSDVDLGVRTIELGLRVISAADVRLVHHESATRKFDGIPENDFWVSYLAYRRWLSRGDPFYNPNLTLLASDCSLRMDARTGEDLALEVLAHNLPGSVDPGVIARASQVNLLAAQLDELDFDSKKLGPPLAKSTAQPSALKSKGRIDSVTWLVPSFAHPFGGIHTILRFADRWRRSHGVRNDFVVYSNPGAIAAQLEAKVATIFPELPGRFRVLSRREELGELPACDLVMATLWTSAYFAHNHPRAAARAYFVQDFEPLFYPAGTSYALAEETYRLGLYGIFNTRGLMDYVTKTYPMAGCCFQPCVDVRVFHPPSPPRSGVVRVFFYGRPSVDRNGFELGLRCLKQLKREFGNGVEIVSAGERWYPEHYGAAGVITNLGVLPYAATGDLYRSCDVGLVFMFTKHPSYLPFEMMACGTTVVTNDNPANAWLLQHDVNCLLSTPTMTNVVAQLRRAVADGALRQRLGEQAVKRVTQTTWDEEIDRVYATLTDAGMVQSPRVRESRRDALTAS